MRRETLETIDLFYGRRAALNRTASMATFLCLSMFGCGLLSDTIDYQHPILRCGRSICQVGEEHPPTVNRLMSDSDLLFRETIARMVSLFPPSGKLSCAAKSRAWAVLGELRAIFSVAGQELVTPAAKKLKEWD
jgi:hypothetical protein